MKKFILNKISALLLTAFLTPVPAFSETATFNPYQGSKPISDEVAQNFFNGCMKEENSMGALSGAYCNCLINEYYQSMSEQEFLSFLSSVLQKNQIASKKKDDLEKQCLLKLSKKVQKGQNIDSE